MQSFELLHFIRLRGTAFSRGVAAFLITAYLLTNHSGISYAAPNQNAGTAGVLQNISRPLPPVSQIQVPSKIGKIEEVFQGPSSQTVFLIQDAHAVPDAQRHIWKLIEHFEKRYGIRQVAVEGAAGELDARFFKSFPGKEEISRILEDYLVKGELSGANAAAIFSGKSSSFHGVEDWALYQEGLGHFLKAGREERRILKELKAEESKVRREKREVYSEKLLEIDSAVESYSERHENLPEVLAKLAAVLAPAKGSSVEMLLTELENKKGHWGKDDAEREVRYADMSGRFSREFEAYAHAVKEKLFRNDQERKLDEQSRQIYLLKKLAKLELTREEWEEIKKETGNMSPQLAFYQNAEQRDEVFLKKLHALKENSLFIAGGFHAQGLAQKLKEAGLSYVIIRPEIRDLPSHSIYRQQMEGRVSWSPYFRIENGSVNLYEAFARAVRDKLLNVTSDKRQVTGNKSHVTRHPLLLKLWRDQIIRDLAQQEKIGHARRYTRFLDELKNDSHRLDRFISGLQRLDGAQWKAENIFRLFFAAGGRPSTMSAAAVAGQLASRAGLPVKSLPVVLSVSRSELRAEPGPEEKVFKLLSEPEKVEHEGASLQSFVIEILQETNLDELIRSLTQAYPHYAVKQLEDEDGNKLLPFKSQSRMLMRSRLLDSGSEWVVTLSSKPSLKAFEVTADPAPARSNQLTLSIRLLQDITVEKFRLALESYLKNPEHSIVQYAAVKQALDEGGKPISIFQKEDLSVVLKQDSQLTVILKPVPRRSETRVPYPRAGLKGLPVQEAEALIIDLDMKTTPGLSVVTWPQRDSLPFNAEETEKFKTGKGLDQNFDPAAHQIERVRHTFYDRSSGQIEIWIAVKVRGREREYYLKTSGADTSSMNTLKAMQPRFSELVDPAGAAFTSSIANLGDLPGYFLISSTDQNRWRFWGGSNEPWHGKSHRVLVEFKDGQRMLGSVSMDGDPKTNQIRKVHFQSFSTKFLPRVLDPAATRFILSAYTLGWPGVSEKALLKEYYTKYSDLRHIFAFPYIEKEAGSSEKVSLFYDQLLQGEVEKKLKEAYDGRPLDFLLQYPGGRPVDAARLAEVLKVYGYKRKESAEAVTRPGHYFISESNIRLIFLPAVYPINGMAVSKDGKHAALVTVKGRSGNLGVRYKGFFPWIKSQIRKNHKWSPAAFFIFDNGMDPQVTRRPGQADEEILIKGGRNMVNAALNVLGTGRSEMRSDEQQQIHDRFRHFLRVYRQIQITNIQANNERLPLPEEIQEAMQISSSDFDRFLKDFLEAQFMVPPLGVSSQALLPSEPKPVVEDLKPEQIKAIQAEIQRLKPKAKPAKKQKAGTGKMSSGEASLEDLKDVERAPIEFPPVEGQGALKSRLKKMGVHWIRIEDNPRSGLFRINNETDIPLRFKIFEYVLELTHLGLAVFRIDPIPENPFFSIASRADYDPARDKDDRVLTMLGRISGLGMSGIDAKQFSVQTSTMEKVKFGIYRTGETETLRIVALFPSVNEKSKESLLIVSKIGRQGESQKMVPVQFNKSENYLLIEADSLRINSKEGTLTAVVEKKERIYSLIDGEPVENRSEMRTEKAAQVVEEIKAALNEKPDAETGWNSIEDILKKVISKRAAAADFFQTNEIEEIGNALIAEWQSRGWDMNDLQQFVFFLSPFESFNGFEHEYTEAESRKAFLFSGDLKRQLKRDFLWGFGGGHIRYHGPHVLDAHSYPSDNEVLADTVRRFIPLLAAREEYSLEDPELSDDLLYWQLSQMTDPWLHDTEMGFTQPEGWRLWPNGFRQAAIYYAGRMFKDLKKVDANGQLSGEILPSEKIAQILTRALVITPDEWKKRGFRQPSEFAIPVAKGYLSSVKNSGEEFSSAPFLKAPFLETVKRAPEIYEQEAQRVMKKYRQKYHDLMLFKLEIFLDWPEIQKIVPGMREVLMKELREKHPEILKEYEAYKKHFLVRLHFIELTHFLNGRWWLLAEEKARLGFKTDRLDMDTTRTWRDEEFFEDQVDGKESKKTILTQLIHARIREGKLQFFSDEDRAFFLQLMETLGIPDSAESENRSESRSGNQHSFYVVRNLEYPKTGEIDHDPVQMKGFLTGEKNSAARQLIDELNLLFRKIRKEIPFADLAADPAGGIRIPAYFEELKDEKSLAGLFTFSPSMRAFVLLLPELEAWFQKAKGDPDVNRVWLLGILGQLYRHDFGHIADANGGISLEPSRKEEISRLKKVFWGELNPSLRRYFYSELAELRANFFMARLPEGRESLRLNTEDLIKTYKGKPLNSVVKAYLLALLRITKSGLEKKFWEREVQPLKESDQARFLLILKMTDFFEKYYDALVYQERWWEKGTRSETRAGWVEQKELPIEDWTMHQMRPVENKRIETEWEKMPQLRLQGDLKSFPELLPRGRSSAGAYLGLVEGMLHPVVIKMFKGRKADMEELINAQIFDRLGIGPRIYGVVTLADGSSGYVMQVVPGKDFDLRGEELLKEKDEMLSRAAAAGLIPTDYIVTPSGHLVMIDAGNAFILEQKKYDAFIRSEVRLSANALGQQDRLGTRRSEMREEEKEKEQSPEEKARQAEVEKLFPLLTWMPNISDFDKELLKQTVEEGMAYREDLLQQIEDKIFQKELSSEEDLLDLLLLISFWIDKVRASGAFYFGEEFFQGIQEVDLEKKIEAVVSRYVMGEIHLEDAVRFMTQSMGRYAGSETAGRRLQALLEKPMKRLLEMIRNDFHTRVLKEGKTVSGVSPPGEIKHRFFYALGYLFYRIIGSDVSRFFFSPVLWMLFASFFGGITLASIFGFIVHFVMRPLHEAIIFTLKDYFEGSGREKIPYQNYPFGAATLHSGSSWDDIQNAYLQTLSLSVKGQTFPPELKLYILENLLERVPEQESTRKLAERVRLRILSGFEGITLKKKWEIVADEIQKANLPFTAPQVILILDILRISSQLSPLMDAVDVFREERKHGASMGEHLAIFGRFFKALMTKPVLKEVFWRVFIAVTFSVPRSAAHVLNLRTTADWISKWQNQAALYVGIPPKVRSIIPFLPREDTQVSPWRQQKKGEAAKKELLDYLKELGVEELNPLIQFLETKVHFKFEPFLDHSWVLPVAGEMNLHSEGKHFFASNYQYDFENKTIRLSSAAPLALNAMVLLKFAPFGFDHHVLRGEKQNFHFADPVFAAPIRKAVWRMFKAQFRVNQDFLYFLPALFHGVSGRVYSYANVPAVLKSPAAPIMTQAFVKAKESFLISVYLIFGQRFLATTTLEHYPATGPGEHGKLSFLFGLIKPLWPFITTFSSFLTYLTVFMAIFAGFFMNLDLEFLGEWAGLIKDALVKIDFLNIGDAVHWAAENIKAVYHWLKEQVDFAWIREIFRFLARAMQPIRIFAGEYLAPFFYYLVFPLSMFVIGMIAGYPFSRMHAKLHALIMKDLVPPLLVIFFSVPVNFVKGGFLIEMLSAEEAVSRVHFWWTNAVQRFFEREWVKKGVRWISLFLFHGLYSAASLLTIMAYAIVLAATAYPPFDVALFFNVLHSFGIPINIMMIIFIAAFFIGLPYAFFFTAANFSGYAAKKWMSEKLSKHGGKFYGAAIFLLALTTVAVPASFRWFYATNPWGLTWIRENKEGWIYELRHKWLLPLDFIRIEDLAEDEKGNFKIGVEAVLKGYGVFQRAITYETAGLDGLVDSKTGHASLDIQLSKNKQSLLKALDDKVPAVYGNSILWDDLFRKHKKGKELEYYNAFTADEWRVVLNHMFEILETEKLTFPDGKRRYKNYPQTYFFRRKALDVIDEFIGGRYIPLHYSRNPDFRMKSFEMVDAEGQKVPAIALKLDVPMRQLMAEMIERRLQLQIPDRDIQYLIDQDADFTEDMAKALRNLKTPRSELRSWAEELKRHYEADPARAVQLAPLIEGGTLSSEEGDQVVMDAAGRKLVEHSPFGTTRFFDLNGRWILTLDPYRNKIDELLWNNNQFVEARTLNGDRNLLRLEASPNGLVLNVQDAKTENRIYEFYPGVDFNQAEKIPYATLSVDMMGLSVEEAISPLGVANSVFRILAYLAKDQETKLTYTGNPGGENFPTDRLFNSISEVARFPGDLNPAHWSLPSSEDTAFLTSVYFLSGERRLFRAHSEHVHWEPDPPERAFHPDNGVFVSVRHGQVERALYNGRVFWGEKSTFGIGAYVTQEVVRPHEQPGLFEISVGPEVRAIINLQGEIISEFRSEMRTDQGVLKIEGYRYRIKAKLGTALSSIYKVSALEGPFYLKGDLMVKIQKPKGDPEESKKWHEQEVRMSQRWAESKHPSSIPVLEEGFDETLEAGWIMMPWQEGESLADWAENKPHEDILNVLEKTFQAAGEVHKQGIIHVDLKPSNILVTADLEVKLLDFGASQPAGEIPGHTTPFFAPYEVMESLFAGTSRPAAAFHHDTFALGVTLLRLAAGYDGLISLLPPEKKDSKYTVPRYYLLINELPLKDRAKMEELIRRRVPESWKPFSGWIAKAIDFKPENRYQTAAEMIEAFQEIRAGQDVFYYLKQKIAPVLFPGRSFENLKIFSLPAKGFSLNRLEEMTKADVIVAAGLGKHHWLQILAWRALWEWKRKAPVILTDEKELLSVSYQIVKVNDPRGLLYVGLPRSMKGMLRSEARMMSRRAWLKGVFVLGAAASAASLTYIILSRKSTPAPEVPPVDLAANWPLGGGWHDPSEKFLNHPEISNAIHEVLGSLDMRIRRTEINRVEFIELRPLLDGRERVQITVKAHNGNAMAAAVIVRLDQTSRRVEPGDLLDLQDAIFGGPFKERREEIKQLSFWGKALLWAGPIMLIAVGIRMLWGVHSRFQWERAEKSKASAERSRRAAENFAKVEADEKKAREAKAAGEHAPIPLDSSSFDGVLVTMAAEGDEVEYRVELKLSNQVFRIVAKDAKDFSKKFNIYYPRKILKAVGPKAVRIVFHETGGKITADLWDPLTAQHIQNAINEVEFIRFTQGRSEMRQASRKIAVPIHKNRDRSEILPSVRRSEMRLAAKKILDWSLGSEMPESELRYSAGITARVGKEKMIQELERLRDEFETAQHETVQNEINGILEKLAKLPRRDYAVGYSIPQANGENEIGDFIRLIKNFGGIHQVFIRREEKIPDQAARELREMGVTISRNLTRPVFLSAGQTNAGLVASNEEGLGQLGLISKFLPVVRVDEQSGNDPEISRLVMTIQTAVALLIAEDMLQKSELRLKPAALLKQYGILMGAGDSIISFTGGRIEISSSAVASYIQSLTASRLTARSA